MLVVGENGGGGSVGTNQMKVKFYNIRSHAGNIKI